MLRRLAAMAVGMVLLGTGSHAVDAAQGFVPGLSARNISELPLPRLFDAGPIVRGPDGNVWIGETPNTLASGRIARVTPLGVISTFDVGGQGGPSTLGSGGGSIWFSGAGYVGKMHTDGTFVKLPLQPGTCVGHAIVEGPDRNMWFTDPCSKSIGRITQAGVVAEFPVPNAATPEFITPGPDGDLWFSLDEFHTMAKSDSSGHITTVNLSDSILTRELIDGHDGYIYLEDSYLGTLLKISPTGFVTRFNFGSFGNRQDIGLALGPDGRIWMVSAPGQVMTFDRTTGQFSVPIDLPVGRNGHGAVGEKGIVVGSDGDMWFTSGDEANGANYLGVYEL
jgi:virginiamycin B lyase